MELKYNKDADTALAQVKRRRYASRLEHYKGNLLLVGINYDKGASNEGEGFNHHTCVMDKA